MKIKEFKTLIEEKLAAAQVTLDLGAYDQKALEKSPPAVFVCNQLLPGVDEWILLHLLFRRFESAKLLYPYPVPPSKLLREVTLRPRHFDLRTEFFRPDFAKKVAKFIENETGIGLFIDFSDNPLSHLGKNFLRPQILRELRKAGIPVVPVHLVADHPPGSFLRKAIPGLPHHFASEPVRVNVRVGAPISGKQIAAFPGNRQWAKFLQAKIFSLGSPFEVRPEQFVGEKPENQEPLAEPVLPELVEADIASLKAEHKITSRGQFDVFIAPFHALPNAMFEIARLREITFRANGEGTGKKRDMDEYDIYYLQMLIWDRQEKRIVGGYRLGQGDLIFKRFGINGFYISETFKMNPALYPLLQQAVELGRSYVVPEYQRRPLPLFLLWKGILYFLLANPHYRYLYGPVSISKYYSDVSKSVIIEFVKRYFYDHELAALVKPRKPFRVKSKAINTRLLAENLGGEFDALENFVEDIEPAHFKVPVLFRQYLKQNARFIAFNVDPNFSDCLDGLMILDVQNVPPGTLEALQQEK